jgi:hypothetical protein
MAAPRPALAPAIAAGRCIHFVGASSVAVDIGSVTAVVTEQPLTYRIPLHAVIAAIGHWQYVRLQKLNIAKRSGAHLRKVSAASAVVRQIT